MKAINFKKNCCHLTVALTLCSLFASCDHSDTDPVINPNPIDTIPLTIGFKALGLNHEVEVSIGDVTPQLHQEGTKLYACTVDGLYAYDLTSQNPQWTCAGFNGIAIQDYVRNGENNIIALCQQEKVQPHMVSLVLSKDNGKTWSDYTPQAIKEQEYCKVRGIAQCPSNPNKLLISAIGSGVYLSEDFGASWKRVTDQYYGNSRVSALGFHPTDPNFFYQSGENFIFEGHLNFTKDNGKTWTNITPHFGGDNCIHGLTFHPTNPNVWVYGGEGIFSKSVDGGQTWTTQNYWENPSMREYWYHTLFDQEAKDCLYMIGSNNEKSGDNNMYTHFVWSDNCGDSWTFSKSFGNEGELEGTCWSVVQDKYYLYVLVGNEVYMIPKKLIRNA